MAISRTTVPDSEDYWGKQRVVSQDITLDTSYPTGGYSLAASALGWSEIRGVVVQGGNAASIGYSFVYDTTNKKLLAGVGTGVAHSHALLLKNAAVADGATTRVNGGTNLLGANTGSDITVAGGGANGGVQAATAANAAFTEVANAVNLSTIRVRLQFVGI